MRILFIGDIVSRLGREVTASLLPKIKKDARISLVIANGENIAGGRGATKDTLDEMQKAGVDYFTSGNHIFWRKNFKDEIEELPIIRPANYPEDIVGSGYTTIDCGEEGQVLLINLLGKTFMRANESASCPFRTVDRILENFEKNELKAVIVDFHAESTSEKQALGYYLDGRVSAVVGTHTHVPSADARLLPNGTAFITDVGMTGPRNSVLGVEPEIIIKKITTPYPQKFTWVKKGEAVFNSVIIKTVNKTSAESITRNDYQVNS